MYEYLLLYTNRPTITVFHLQKHLSYSLTTPIIYNRESKLQVSVDHKVVI